MDNTIELYVAPQNYSEAEKNGDRGEAGFDDIMQTLGKAEFDESIASLCTDSPCITKIMLKTAIKDTIRQKKDRVDLDIISTRTSYVPGETFEISKGIVATIMTPVPVSKKSCSIDVKTENYCYLTQEKHPHGTGNAYFEDKLIYGTCDIAAFYIPHDLQHTRVTVLIMPRDKARKCVKIHGIRHYPEGIKRDAGTTVSFENAEKYANARFYRCLSEDEKEVHYEFNFKDGRRYTAVKSLEEYEKQIALWHKKNPPKAS